MTPDEQRRERDEFERLGAELVRLRIEFNGGITPASKRLAEDWLQETRAAAEEKRAEAERRETKRYRQIRYWTIVAGVAGVIAAITGIISVLRG